MTLDDTFVILKALHRLKYKGGQRYKKAIVLLSQEATTENLVIAKEFIESIERG